MLGYFDSNESRRHPLHTSCIGAGISIILVDAKLYKMAERYVMNRQCKAARRICRKEEGQELQAAGPPLPIDPSFSFLPTKSNIYKKRLL
jgi:hypothetical protein